MPNPAFIVEGQMEQRVLQRICKGRPAKRIGCNGDEVPMSRMAVFVETQIRSLGNRHHPVFVIFDREKRADSAEKLKEDLINCLRDRGLDVSNILVFVADRETEQWLLYDLETICLMFDLEPPREAPIGKGGLKKLIAGRVNYHETTVGVEIFLAVDKAKIAAQCPVFHELRQSALAAGCESTW